MLARLMSDLLIDGEILLDNIKAVIFDKDGTLIDIHHYWASMIKIRASLVALKWFNNNEKDKIESHLIDIMGVNLETGQMKPDGPVGVKPRPFNIGIVGDFVTPNDITMYIYRAPNGLYYAIPKDKELRLMKPPLVLSSAEVEKILTKPQ